VPRVISLWFGKPGAIGIYLSECGVPSVWSGNIIFRLWGLRTQNYQKGKNLSLPMHDSYLLREKGPQPVDW
jgi:hypothetical protein